REAHTPRRVDRSANGRTARLRASPWHRRRRIGVNRTPRDQRPDRKGGRIAHNRSVTVRKDQSGSVAPPRADGRRRRTDTHAQSQTPRRGRKEQGTDRLAVRLEGVEMIADLERYSAARVSKRLDA